MLLSGLCVHCASVLMLNTDLHNPHVKHRMSKADFIKCNRGIDRGQDLPASLLTQVYDEIRGSRVSLLHECACLNRVTVMYVCVCCRS